MITEVIRDERLFLLKAFGSGLEEELAHDPHLELRVRCALSDLERGSHELEARRAKVKELTNLYDEYGPPTIKCLLEYIFLLHSDDELDELLAPILDKFEEDLEENTLLADAFLSELTNFSRSPYQITRDTVVLVLKRILQREGAVEHLLDSADLNFELSYAAVQYIVEKGRQDLYHRVVTIITSLSRSCSSEEYLRKTRPLIKLFVKKTGEPGLKVVVDLFKKGALDFSGKYNLIASFGMTFYHWFISNPPPPSKDWASVLVIVPKEIGDIETRDEVMNLLLDKWAMETHLARTIRRLLVKRMTNDRFYPELFSDRVKNKLLKFENFDWQLNKCIKDILDNLTKREDIWKRFGDKLHKGGFEGKATALALLKSTRNDQLRLMSWLESFYRYKGFISAALSNLFRTYNFEKLPAEIQLKLLENETFRDFITSHVLFLLLNHCETMDERVKDLIQRLLKEITVKYGTSNIPKD